MWCKYLWTVHPYCNNRNPLTCLALAYLLFHSWLWYLTPQVSSEYKEIAKQAGMNSILWMKLSLRHMNLDLWSLASGLGMSAWRSKASAVYKELGFHNWSLVRIFPIALELHRVSVILASCSHGSKRSFNLTLKHAHRNCLSHCSVLSGYQW